ncbi:MAG: hypothetical protein ACHQ7N_09635 [Candidatus Methylomirabilales bacterium]
MHKEAAMFPLQRAQHQGRIAAIAALLLLVSVCLPGRSHAMITGISPGTLTAGTSTPVTLSGDASDFDVSGPLLGVWYEMSDGPVQYAEISFTRLSTYQARATITLPAHATGSGGIAVFDNTSGLWAGSGANFSIAPSPTTQNILSDVTPKQFYRGRSYSPTLTFSDFNSTLGITLALSTEADGQGGIVSVVGGCVQNPCGANWIDIPADAPLGTAYFRNAASGGPGIAVTILDGVPDVVTGMTPGSGIIGGPDVTLTFTGSDFTETVQVCCGPPDPATGSSLPLATTWLNASTVQAVLPSGAFAQLGEGRTTFSVVDSQQGVDGWESAWPFDVLEPGGTDLTLAVLDMLPHDPIPAGNCVPRQVVTNTLFPQWPAHPMLAYKYPIGPTEGNPDHVPSGYDTRAIPLTAEMFVPSGPGTFAITATVCLPDNAMQTSVNGRMAPGGMVNGQPDVWVYPQGVQFAIGAYQPPPPTILSITPSAVSAGSPDTTVTLRVTNYDPSTTDLWMYSPGNDGWYLIGTDAGSFVSVDPGSLQVTIPSQYLANPTTLTMELYNNDTNAYDDRALPVVDPPASLSVGSLQQRGANVSVSVAWTQSVTSTTIDCGTVPSQTIGDPNGGSCVYTAPGTFTVTGSYWDGMQTQHPAPVQVVVPALVPAGASLHVTLADGALPPEDLSGPFPVATMTMPSVYPVPVQLSLTLDPPTPGPVGIADPPDLTVSRIRIKPIAQTADLTASWSASDDQMTLQTGADASHLQASTSLTHFAPHSNDPSHWRQRFILVGQTLTGLPVSTELVLQGPVGDGSQVIFNVHRINPIYPYTPATYVYQALNMAGGVSGEPMTQTWTVTGTGESRPSTSIQGAANYPVTYTTSGTKNINLVVSGPFSGWKVWTDSVIVPTAPPANPIAFYTTVPTNNRPPATYRFAPNYPPLPAGEKFTGNPTWSVDGVTQYTGSIFYYTFTAAGQHTVTVSQPTTLPRLISGTTTVTVNVNQLPVGTIDCSGSYINKTVKPVTYVLSCKAANTADPDGRIASLVWTLPDVPYQNLNGSTYFKYTFATAQAVRVQLLLTDDSADTATIETTVDLSTLH